MQIRPNGILPTTMSRIEKLPKGLIAETTKFPKQRIEIASARDVLVVRLRALQKAARRRYATDRYVKWAT